MQRAKTICSTSKLKIGTGKTKFHTMITKKKIKNPQHLDRKATRQHFTQRAMNGQRVKRFLNI
jgi:hypothetical protein